MLMIREIMNCKPGKVRPMVFRALKSSNSRGQTAEVTVDAERAK